MTEISEIRLWVSSSKHWPGLPETRAPLSLMLVMTVMQLYKFLIMQNPALVNF